MRRFLAAGHSDSTWLVAIEVGGRAHHAQGFLIVGHEPVQTLMLAGLPRTLAELREIPG